MNKRLVAAAIAALMLSGCASGAPSTTAWR